MVDISKCQENLLALASQQGYLTFDDILNASEAFSLSVTEVDILSEAIQLRGIIVYESTPQQNQPSQSDEDVLDYSRTDYDAVFDELIELAPQLIHLVNEIKLFPAPQWGEINQLAHQIAEGNQFARDRMIMLYMRSVLKIALSMTKQYDLDIEDAVSSGFIGLINAVDRFDPSGFSAFHSYAAMWIQQGIQRDCNPKWVDYYFPAHYKDKLFRISQKFENYTSGENPGTPEFDLLVNRISEELGVSETELENALTHYFNQKYWKESLEEIQYAEMAEGAMLRSPVVNEDDVFEIVFQENLSEAIENILSALTEREAEVIRMRNGMGPYKEMTLEEIGSILNITRERVRQIEEKAMRKICHPRRRIQLEQFL